MNKKVQRLIVVMLVVCMVASTVAYAISAIFTSYTSQTTANTINESETEEASTEDEATLTYAEALQEALNNAIKEGNVIKESVLNDLIKRNGASDYALTTTLNILGTPVCVLECIDGYTIRVYTDEDEIIDLLNGISTNEEYTEDSFIQLYWMRDNGEAIITWIALAEEDMSEVKTIGIITSQYHDLDEMDLETSDAEISTFEGLELSRDEFIEEYNPTLYQTQNKLLECVFTTNLMEGNEYNYTWYEYVLKNDDGYLYVNFQDDAMYMVYQNYEDVSNVNVVSQEEIDALYNGMTTEDFLKAMPEAKFYEIYLYNNTTTYTSYVVRTSEDDTTYTYYDFREGVLDLPETEAETETSTETTTSAEN